MKIQLINGGKRFNTDWVFRKVDLNFLPHETYAITGANGSGKSTLLQVLAGSMALSTGTIQWTVDGTIEDPDRVFRHLSIAAPYVDVVEEMTALEFLAFHHRFKPLVRQVTIPQILSVIGLEHAAHKQIRYFSSGMKQRIKLAQAIFSDVPLLLLDEPCTNFDTKGYELYNHLVQEYAKDKTIIISSNDVHEYAFCRHIIQLQDFK